MEDEGTWPVGDAALWDIKYEQGLPSLTEPDPFFVAAYHRLVDRRFPGHGNGLDVAGGLGRHALWLAAKGWQMSVVDISAVAIGNLAEEAAKRNLKLDLFTGDAADYGFEAARFDLIVLFYHFDRRLFPMIASTLNPGGLLICKMALRWESESELSPAAHGPLNRNELPLLLPELQILDHGERPVRDRGVVEFVGVKR